MKTSKLEKFLINRGLLEAFTDNLKHTSHRTIIRLCRRHKIDNLFIESFDWMLTEQGYLFWSKLNQEWIHSSDKL